MYKACKRVEMTGISHVYDFNVIAWAYYNTSWLYSQ